MSAPYSIAPHANFLETLVDRVLDGTLLGGWPQEGPFWLADVTIILPTRRARLKLAEAFLARGHCLLPDIRTFVGEHGDEEPFLPSLDVPSLPLAVGLTGRRLVLARLIDAWARTSDGRASFATPPNGAEVLALADSLAELLDDLSVAGVTHRALREIAPEALAANWQETLKYHDVVLAAWPEVLSERGMIDAVSLRNERLARQAAVAPLIYGSRPVIAAGSTGSIPATAKLLGAIAALPRGAIVLPGLDTSLSAAGQESLLTAADGRHGHPQYGLAQLLNALGSRPGEVTELAAEPSARTLVLRRALALAEDTAGWSAERSAFEPLLQPAADGIAILVARTEDHEARAIALAAREALSNGRTVGIVSPDRNLARRIAVELRRFSIEVDDAAGTPLFHSPAGRLARQLLAVAQSDFAPVDLMALLRNRAVTLGRERTSVARAADALELKVLRGHLLRSGLAGLRSAVAANLAGADEFKRLRLSGEEAAAIGQLLTDLNAGLQPLAAVGLVGGLMASTLAAALADAFLAVAPGDIPGSAEFAAWAAEFALHAGEGPSFPPVALDAVLAGLMAGFAVRKRVPRRDDLFIWGQLEARLQGPDLMILAGINEDIWPATADPGPWLSSGMRSAIGLEPPERQQGQAAHDFTMAMGTEAVIVAYSERIGTGPATPSRLLQRVEAFLGEEIATAARHRGQRFVIEAHRLDATGVRPKAAPRPSPRPRLEVRPKQLSVTEIERLYRSPYDIYAKHVLRLSALDPLGQPPGGRERGSLVHDVFARFIIEGHPFDRAAQGKLEAMAREAFAGLESIADRSKIWERRFSVAAQLFLEFERERDRRIGERHAEISGRWEFPIGFTLTGRADRVDLTGEETIEIIDFKTGSIPEPKAMRNFEAPQLLLEAAMMQAVGIGGMAPAVVTALTYVKIGSGTSAYRPRPFTPRDDDLQGAITEAEQRLQRHVAEFLLKDDLAMVARIVPDAKQRFRGEFDHLARTAEWLVQEDEDF